jgi:hypothetical protein
MRCAATSCQHGDYEIYCLINEGNKSGSLRGIGLSVRSN